MRPFESTGQNDIFQTSALKKYAAPAESFDSNISLQPEKSNCYQNTSRQYLICAFMYFVKIRFEHFYINANMFDI